jgi:hypothetical protein
MSHQIPESYFLRLVEPSKYNTRNSFQNTGLPRASDASVYFNQYPLGWLFFSRDHIAKLLEVGRTILPGLALDDIAPEMVKVWDIMARDTYMDPNDAQNLSRGLEMLDNELLRRLQDGAARLETGQKYYGGYITDPYTKTRAPVPINASNMNKAVRTTDTAGFIQGGNFDVSATNAKVPSFQLPVVADLVKYA